VSTNAVAARERGGAQGDSAGGEVKRKKKLTRKEEGKTPFSAGPNHGGTKRTTQQKEDCDKRIVPQEDFEKNSENREKKEKGGEILSDIRAMQRGLS